MNALRWYGGKARQHKWINGVLGPNRKTYVEPFFGMGAVLLNRQRSWYECVSDINGRVVNWWKVLQTQTDELAEAITATPYSRQVFDEAKDKLDEGTPMERAVRFTTVVTQTFASSDNVQDTKWTSTAGGGWLALGFADKLRRVAMRVRKVAIENKCATHTLRRYSKKKDVLVYCDPPYWGQSKYNDAYTKSDEVELSELLLAQHGRVVISGFGDAWDHLGWERHEKRRPILVSERSGHFRTEVCWCNGK